MLMSCRSASSPSSWKIFSIKPLSDHSLNRLYTVEYGPYLSGRSRQAAPLRAIQKMPFSICLGSRLGRPLSPICRSGNQGFRRSHSASVSSYRRIIRFMSLTSRVIFDVTSLFSFWFYLTNCIFPHLFSRFMLLETHSSITSSKYPD